MKDKKDLKIVELELMNKSLRNELEREHFIIIKIYRILEEWALRN